MRTLHYEYLGRRAYEPTWDLQRRLAHGLRESVPNAAETLLAVEHDPVITIGRRGRAEDILSTEQDLHADGVDVYEVDRGGEVTFHGPGQLVIYPIVRVIPRHFGVGDLVRGLAGAIAATLSELGIDSLYDPDNPGLWIGGAKICAVGMRVSGGVSTHGAALNVTTDLGAFGRIVACGRPDAATTSLARELAPERRPPSLHALAERVAQHFATRFDFRLMSEPDARGSSAP